MYTLFPLSLFSPTYLPLSLFSQDVDLASSYESSVSSFDGTGGSGDGRRSSYDQAGPSRPPFPRGHDDSARLHSIEESPPPGRKKKGPGGVTSPRASAGPASGRPPPPRFYPTASVSPEPPLGFASAAAHYETAAEAAAAAEQQLQQQQLQQLQLAAASPHPKPAPPRGAAPGHRMRTPPPGDDAGGGGGDPPTSSPGPSWAVWPREHRAALLWVFAVLAAFLGVVALAGGVLFAVRLALLEGVYRIGVRPDHLALNQALEVFGLPDASADFFGGAAPSARPAHVRIGSQSSSSSSDEVLEFGSYASASPTAAFSPHASLHARGGALWTCWPPTSPWPQTGTWASASDWGPSPPPPWTWAGLCSSGAG